MATGRQEDAKREICIEAWNMLFGRAVFAYISLPSSWVTGYQINDPMVTNRFLYKNLVWVGTGEIECLIAREHGSGKRPDLDFRATLVVDRGKEAPVAPTPEDLLDRHMRKGHQVLDHGKLRAGGHRGSFALWTSSRPRFGIFGRPRLDAKIEGFVPCDETGRLLRLTWTSPSPDLILEHSGELIESLTSILCHGREDTSETGLL